MIRYKNIKYFTEHEEFCKEYRQPNGDIIKSHFDDNGFLVIFEDEKHYQNWCSCPNEYEKLDNSDCIDCKFLRERIATRDKKLERICK
jgi:poly(3-hydroxybutyrate) depolymerase